MHVQPMRSPSSEWVLAVDDELVQRVMIRMQTRLGNQVQNFQMSGRADGLILRGQVKTCFCKQMVQEVVMEVSGLSILSNDIDVGCCGLMPRTKAAAK